MLVLFSEVVPIYTVSCIPYPILRADSHRSCFQRTSNFYGHAFVWNMLNNFGGRMGLFGTLQSVAEGPAAALASTNFTQGLGMTMESIWNNYIMCVWLLRI